MSSSTVTISVDALLNLRATVDNLLAGKAIAVSGSVAKRQAKKQRKPSARAGQPTVRGDFTKKCLEDHKDEVKAYKEAHPDQKGAHIVFVSEYIKEHDAEYRAFEAAWKEAHPKVEKPAAADDSADDAASDAGSESSGSAAEGEKVKKPRKVRSEEEKAATKAKAAATRAANKAKKEAEKAGEEAEAKEEAAPAPVAEAAAPAAEKPKKQPKKAQKAKEEAPAPAPVVAPAAPAAEAEEDDAPEFLPFTLGKAKYLRLGVPREGSEPLWASGDLWESKKGARGDYAGMLQDDGSIDASAEEPNLE